MRKIIGFLLLATLMSCNYCVDASGINKEKSLELDEFNSVDIIGSADLTIKKGACDGRIIADEHIMPLVDVSVKDGTLNIKTGKCKNDLSTVKITACAERLNDLTISGSGSIKSDGVDAGNLNLNIKGSGTFDLYIDKAEKITSKILGSGDILLAGVADIHNALISGSGNILAYDLSVSEGKVTISGSGTAEVQHLDDLDAIITGSGNIFYKGEPELTKEISGSGKIESAE